MRWPLWPRMVPAKETDVLGPVDIRQVRQIDSRLKLRNAQGWTQEDLAGRVGLSTRYVGENVDKSDEIER